MPTITHFFTQDHMRMDRLFERYQESKDRDRAWAIALFLEFKNELEQHMKWEEDIIFPVFLRKLNVPNSDATNKMCVEHVLLRKLLDQILDALDKGEDACRTSENLSRSSKNIMTKRMENFIQDSIPWPRMRITKKSFLKFSRNAAVSLLKMPIEIVRLSAEEFSIEF